MKLLNYLEVFYQFMEYIMLLDEIIIVMLLQ
jgi:hypothetical protein